MTPARRWTRRPPDCRRVARVLQSYLDGELSREDDAMVITHLQHCRRCGIDVRVYRQIKQMLQGLAMPPDPVALTRLRAYAADLHGGQPR